MSLKQHLKSICDYEQKIYEQTGRLEQIKSERERAIKRVSEKTQKLKDELLVKKKFLNRLEEDTKKRQTVSTGTIRNTNIFAVTTVAVTIIFHIILNWLLKDVFVATEPLDGLPAFLIMNIVPAACVTWLICMFTTYILWPCILSYIAINIASIGYVYVYIEKHTATMENAIFASMRVLVIIEVIIFALFIWSAVNDYKKQKEKNKKIIFENYKKIRECNKDIIKHQQNIVSYIAESQKALSLMEQDINRQSILIEKLKSELNKLYTMNIVHPKYQSWIAVATLYEYIDVGRCTELQGANGAYNLYEQEVHNKKILNSLNAINSSINMYGRNISTSQSYIRSQLNECNSRLLQVQINTYGL